jgi:hypothetical protein
MFAVQVTVRLPGWLCTWRQRYAPAEQPTLQARTSSSHPAALREVRERVHTFTLLNSELDYFNAIHDEPSRMLSFMMMRQNCPDQTTAATLAQR